MGSLFITDPTNNIIIKVRVSMSGLGCVIVFGLTTRGTYSSRIPRSVDTGIVGGRRQYHHQSVSAAVIRLWTICRVTIAWHVLPSPTTPACIVRTCRGTPAPSSASWPAASPLFAIPLHLQCASPGLAMAVLQHTQHSMPL